MAEERRQDRPYSRQDAPGPLPVTWVILTYQEASNLPACLESLRGMGETWVVDSHSTDGTQDIARHYGANVLTWDWHGYARQRQMALGLGNFDWIGFLDADERLSPELQESIRKFIADPGNASGAWSRREVIFMGKTLRWGGMGHRWFLRLVRRQHAFVSIAELDEKIGAAGPTVRLKGRLIHEDQRPLRDQVLTQIRYAELHPPEPWLYASAPRGWRALALFAFRLIAQGAVLDGPAGLTYHTVGFATRLLRDGIMQEKSKQGAKR